MVYKPFQNTQKKSNTKKILVISMFFLMGIFTIFPNTFVAVSSVTQNIARPILSTGNNLESKTVSFFSYFKSKRAIDDENKSLTLLLKQKDEQLAGYDFLVQENIELKKELLGNTGLTITTNILRRPNVSAYDTFIVDAGENKNIEVGAKVYADDVMLIGVIEEVYSHSSKARLFSTFGQVTNTFIGPENIPLEIHGLGGGAFVAEIPRGLDVQIGDIALSAESPENIVAYVKAQDKNSSDSFDKYYLQSNINIFGVKHIKIEIKRTTRQP